MARFPRLQPVQPSAAGLLFCIRSHRWPKDDSGESLLCQASPQVPKPPLSISSSEKQAPKAGLGIREIYQGNACKGRGRDSGHRPWEPPACNSGSDTCGRRAGRKEGWVGKVSAGGTVLRQFVLAEAEAHSQSSPSEESLGPAPWASVGAPAMRPGGTRSQQDQGSRSRGVAMGNVSQLCFQVLCLPDPCKC